MENCKKEYKDPGPSTDDFEEKCSVTSLQDLISGEVYDGLCRTFLTTGKGRRPDPPTVPKNYTSLLMLESMRVLGNKTYNAVIVWFETLFPDIASKYPVEQLSGKIRRVSSTAGQLIGTELLDFALTPLDLESVSTSLDAFGINISNIYNPLDFENNISCHVTNQLVLDLEKFKRKERMLSSKFVSQWVLKLLNYETKGKESENIMKKCKKLVEKTIKQHNIIKRKGIKSHEVQQFLRSKFDLELTVSEVDISPAMNEKNVEVESNAIKKDKPVPLVKRICGECNKLREEIVALTDAVTTIQREKSELANKLKDLEIIINDKEALAKKEKRKAMLKCLKLSVRHKHKLEQSKNKSRLNQKKRTQKLNKTHTFIKRDLQNGKIKSNQEQKDFNLKLLKSKDKIKRLKVELNSLKHEFSKVLSKSEQTELNPGCDDLKAEYTHVYSDNISQ